MERKGIIDTSNNNLASLKMYMYNDSYYDIRLRNSEKLKWTFLGTVNNKNMLSVMNLFVFEISK